jgi:hypothetical protein
MKYYRWFTIPAFCGMALLWMFGCTSKDDDDEREVVIPAITLALHANTPASADVRATATNQPVLLFRLTGDATQDVTVDALTLTFAGSGNASAISLVGIYEDDGAASPGVFDPAGDTLQGSATFASGQAVFSFLPSLPLAAGGTMDLFVVYSFSGTAPPSGGETFAARIDADADLVATTGSGTTATVSGAPVEGQPLLVVGRLQVTAGSSMPGASAHPVATVDIPSLQLRLTALDEDVTVSSVTFTGLALQGQLADLSGVRLVVDANGNGLFDSGTDGPFLGSPGTFGAGTTVTFLANRVLNRNMGEDWLVLIDLGTQHSHNDQFSLALAAAGDVTATGNISTQGAFLSLSPLPLSGPPVGVTSRLDVTAGSAMPPAANHPVSTTDVPVLQFFIEALDENVNVTSLTVTGSTNPGQLSDIAGVKLVVDVNGNGTYESGTDTPFLGSTQTFGGGSTVTFSMTRALTATVGEHWLVLFNFGASHTHGDQFRCSIAAPGDVGASAVGSGNPPLVSLTPTPLDGNFHTVQAVGAVQLSPGGQTPSNGFAAPNATDVLMVHFSLAETTSLESATVTSLRFVLAGGGTPQGNPQQAITQLRLFRDDGDSTFEPGGGATDDPLVATGTVSGLNDVTLGSLTELLPGGGTVSYYAALDFNGTASNGSTFTLSLSDADVSATGNVSTNTLAVTGGTVNGCTITMGTPSATMTIATAAGDASIGNFARRIAALPSANAPAALFTLTAPSSEGALISSITLTHVGNANGQNHIAAVRLYADVGSTPGAVDGGDILLGSQSGGYTGGGTLTLTISPARNLAMAAAEDWLVVYDLSNTCPYARTFQVQVAASADISALGAVSGNPLNVTGTPANSGSRFLGGSWVQGRDDGSTFVYIYFDDTWALTLTPGSEQWSLLNAGGGAGAPPPLRWHASIFYQPGGNPTMLGWGGRRQTGPIETNVFLFDLTGNTWSTLATQGTPPDRVLPGATYDSVNNRMIVFGGWSDSANNNQNDVWELTLGANPTWNQLLSGSAAGAPTPRQGVTCVFDSTTTPPRVIIHGGTTGGSASTDYNDAFALSLASPPTWSTLMTAVTLRGDHAYCLDTSAYQILVFGGWNATSWALNDFEAFDLGLNAPQGTWGYRVSTGTLPATRFWHRGVWDAGGGRFVIYGGEAGMGAGRPTVWGFR